MAPFPGAAVTADSPNHRSTPLHSHERPAAFVQGFAERYADGTAGVRGAILPEVGRGETVEILTLELGEFFAAFPVDELGTGVEAGFGGVFGRREFADGGAGSGGMEGVEAVGVDLALAGRDLGGPFKLTVAGEAAGLRGQGLDCLRGKAERIWER